MYQLCLENIYCTHVARKALLLPETVKIAEDWYSQVATKPFLLFGMGNNSVLRQNQTEGKVLLLPGYTSPQLSCRRDFSSSSSQCACVTCARFLYTISSLRIPSSSSSAKGKRGVVPANLCIKRTRGYRDRRGKGGQLDVVCGTGKHVLGTKPS